MSGIARKLLIALAFTMLAGCATDSRRESTFDTPSNLDEAARGNHNSLLPPDFYESNHEMDD